MELTRRDFLKQACCTTAAAAIPGIAYAANKKLAHIVFQKLVWGDEELLMQLGCKEIYDNINLGRDQKTAPAIGLMQLDFSDQMYDYVLIAYSSVSLQNMTRPKGIQIKRLEKGQNENPIYVGDTGLDNYADWGQPPGLDRIISEKDKIWKKKHRELSLGRRGQSYETILKDIYGTSLVASASPLEIDISSVERPKGGS